MSLSITNSTTNSASASPPTGAAHTPISDDAKMQEIEKLGQQTLAKRKFDAEHPVSFKAARQGNEDAIGELTTFFLTQHRFTVAEPDEKFAELVGKVIQTPIEQKDLPHLLAILQTNQLTLLKNLALSNASKKPY
ncbi:MAG: hypothetical protein LLG04_13435 [Parachlamydia sp.]|nr:hypothetical protein [Parachlamydia sp.]